MVTAFGDLASAAAAAPPPWLARSVLRVVQRGEAEVGLEVQHVMELQADRCVLPIGQRAGLVGRLEVHELPAEGDVVVDRDVRRFPTAQTGRSRRGSAAVEVPSMAMLPGKSEGGDGLGPGVTRTAEPTSASCAARASRIRPGP
jgi:hypothetical protein